MRKYTPFLGIILCAIHLFLGGATELRALAINFEKRIPVKAIPELGFLVTLAQRIPMHVNTVERSEGMIASWVADSPERSMAQKIYGDWFLKQDNLPWVNIEAPSQKDGFYKALALFLMDMREFIPKNFPQDILQKIYRFDVPKEHIFEDSKMRELVGELERKFPQRLRDPLFLREGDQASGYIAVDFDALGIPLILLREHSLDGQVHVDIQDFGLWKPEQSNPNPHVPAVLRKNVDGQWQYLASRGYGSANPLTSKSFALEEWVKNWTQIQKYLQKIPQREPNSAEDQDKISRSFLRFIDSYRGDDLEKEIWDELDFCTREDLEGFAQSIENIHESISMLIKDPNDFTQLRMTQYAQIYSLIQAILMERPLDRAYYWDDQGHLNLALDLDDDATESWRRTSEILEKLETGLQSALNLPSLKEIGDRLEQLSSDVKALCLDYAELVEYDYPLWLGRA